MASDLPVHYILESTFDPLRVFFYFYENLHFRRRLAFTSIYNNLLNLQTFIFAVCVIV